MVFMQDFSPCQARDRNDKRGVAVRNDPSIPTGQDSGQALGCGRSNTLRVIQGARLKMKKKTYLI